MYVCANVFLDMIHMSEFFILGEYFFSFSRKKFSIFNILAIVITVVASITVLLLPVTFFSLLIYGITVWGIYSITYDEKKGVLLCAGIWAMFVTTLLDGMSYSVIDVFTGNGTMRGITLSDLLAQVVTVVFLLVTGFVLKKAGKGRIKNIGVPYMILFSLLIAADTYVLNSLGKFVTNKNMVEQNPSLKITYLIVSLGVFLQILMVLFLIVSRNDLREKERITQKYLENQIEHYRYLELREAETKKFRHDLRSHMFALQSYLQTKQYDEMEQHLNQMYGTVEAFERKICVNNNIVDAILNKYDAECRKQKIQFVVKGHFPVNCEISVYDLCTIFSNLLSNAQEGASEGEERQILVNIRYTKDELIFHIENDYAGTLIVENGKIRTRKCNQDLHGMGLENVKRCVEKNHGYMNIQAENQRFIVKVILIHRGRDNENSSS